MSKVTWVLEDHIFTKAFHQEMLDCLRDQNIPYHIITVTDGAIEGKIPEIAGPVIFYGSLVGRQVCERYGWTPGVWNNPEYFSERKLIDAIGPLALNYDAQTVPFRDAVKTAKTMDWDPFFIKPNSDVKEFAGMIQTQEDFNEWYMKMMTIGYFHEGIEDRPVVISSPKILGKEWRLVVLEQKVIAYSIYRQFQKVIPKRDCPAEVIALAEQVVAGFNPAPVFVVDICETINGLRVVELNGFNSAGLYKCDVTAIIPAVTEFVERTWQ